MGKNRNNNYDVVSELPPNALTVAQYAASRSNPCNTSYIYELVRKGRNNDFQIVVFKDINFVIPLTNH